MKRKSKKVESFEFDQEKALATAENMRHAIFTKVFRWQGVNLNQAETVASHWHRSILKTASAGEIPRMPSDGELAVMVVQLINSIR
ncbi:MAG: hypothetical protein ACFBSC_03265 [Microcoleaceae cyanobacterium]